MTISQNPFDGLYTPDDDGPVAPPAPFAPEPSTGGVLPTAPVAPSPYQPPTYATSAPVAMPAPGSAPQAPPIPAPQPLPTATHPNGPVAPLPASAPSVSQVHEDEDAEKVVLDDLLVSMVDAGGSDLHLSVGIPPTIRVRGEVEHLRGYGVMTARQLQDLLYGIMTDRQRKQFEEALELDFSYTVPGQARFRVNVLKQRGSVGAVMRAIPWEILSLEALGLPEVIGGFAHLHNGLVLVTGETGSGKSTTLAAIIDKANRSRKHHIMTIEDPIEFIHQSRGCVVNQREVGDDTHSFAAALKHVLRQDPDIILVGELRDLETISVALTAAETGHLVFATLHTKSAQDTITRIIDVFPSEQQAQIQTQLAGALQGVVCQTLLKTADGTGRQAAVEIMMATTNVRSLIRDKKLQQIQSALQSGSQHGMQTLNQDLAKHVIAGTVDYDTALSKCSDVDDFNDLVGGRAGAELAMRAHLARLAPTAQGIYGGYAPPPAI